MLIKFIEHIPLVIFCAKLKNLKKGSIYVTIRLTLDALIVLEAIDRNGSFAAASEELHRTRSALTYTIQTLEQDLGILIFDRSGHRARLTDIGKVLLQEGNDILKSASDLEKRVKRLTSGWEEEINITIDDNISIKTLYPLIKIFYQDCTLTKFHIATEVGQGCGNSLISGRADLSIGMMEDFSLNEEFGLISLGTIELVFAIAPAHPLANLPEPLKQTDILKYRQVLLENQEKNFPLRSKKVSSHEENLIVSTVQAKIQAQTIELGVGYLPLHLILNEIKSGKLITKKIETQPIIKNIAVSWNIKRAGKAVEWFIDKLKSQPLIKIV